MAEILKARDITRPASSVIAVKRILPHLTEDKQYVTMFLDESRVLAQLEHDNIIHTLEVGQVGDTPFIALEYVWGQDARMLFHRVRRSEQTIPIGVACYIVTQVCAALHHAHEAQDAYGNSLGLVHRDVSLQNILLSYDGAVKLTDFGIAMSAENIARTEVGVVKGKFGYMSPEQIRGEPMDRRSDVFATGICLYELLTGERLFSGESDYAAVEKVRNVTVEPPSRLNREIPSALEQIVMRALSKHPRDRYQTAADLRRALLAFMAESRGECSAKDLSEYMRSVFADEIAKQPSPDALGADGRLPRDAATGLAAFDNLDPISALSSASAVHPAPGAIAPSVPPPVPRRDSVPAPSPTAAGASAVFPRPDLTAPRPDDTVTMQPSAELGLDWDEDEMMTGTERLEGVQPLSPTPDPDALPGDDEVTRQVYVGETFSGVAVVSGVRPAGGAIGTASAIAPRPSSMPPPARQSSPPFEARELQAMVPPAHYGAVVGVVAAIIAIIAGALYITRGTRAAEIHLATAPANAEVMVDGKRVPGEQSPFVIRDLEPKQPHELEVRMDGYRSWSTRLALESGQVLQLPIVTLTPEVALAATRPSEPAPQPEAAPVQRAPESAPAETPRRPEAPTVTTAPAAHRPRAEPKEAPAPSAVRRTKSPPAPKPRAQSAPAPRAAAAAGGSGVLRINARPWAEVSIDGRPVGNTPLMNLTLSAGSHRVRLRNPQFALEKTIKVQIVAGDVVTKVVDLQ